MVHSSLREVKLKPPHVPPVLAGDTGGQATF